MMTRLFASFVFASAAAWLATATGIAQQALPLKVHVTAIALPMPPILPPEQHEQEITRTKNQVFSTAERLRGEYGNKTKTWPNEAWDVFHAAEDAHAMAVARADYETLDDTDRRLRSLGDSVADVVRDVEKSKVLTRAATLDEAELVILVIGRRQIPADATALGDNTKFVRFRLMPGPAADRARVLEAMRRQAWSAQTTKAIARPLNGLEFADLEAGSPFGMRQAGGWVAGMVERFARERFGPAKK